MLKRIGLILAGLALILSGCTSKAEPSVSTQQANRVADANRQSAAAAAAKAQDASAEKATGQQYQADNDHITGPNFAAAAVKQVLNQPTKQVYHAVPTVNVDGDGHHYYQVDAYSRQKDGGRGHLLGSYFVYLNGHITTKQLD